MSLSSATQTCVRALGRSRSFRICAISKTATPITSRRDLHTPTPLYLDFLAPSWHQRPTAVQSVRPTKSLSSSHRRQFSRSTERGARAITNPRLDSSGAEMSITITPRAAHRLQTISETDRNPDLVLRVSVESGGCHGFQYLMSLTDVDAVDASEDTLFENEDVARPDGDAAYRAKVVMDEASLELLNGSKVDYTMELIGSQFKVTGIPGAKSSCGCGTSFDIAA